jgi:hypothetical protein
LEHEFDQEKRQGAMKPIVNYRIGLMLLIALGSTALAQNQNASNSQSASEGQSLGDYARHVRKAPTVSNAQPKVFDNDNLPKGDKLSIVGKVAPPPKAENEEKPANAEAKPGEAGKPATGEKPAENAPAKAQEDEASKQTAWKQWDDKIKAQQDQINLITRELDVVQREYQIRAAAMYADAGNRLRNSGDWDKQDAQYKQQIADKQKALEGAKAKMEELRDQARKAGVPNSVQEQ